MHRGAMVVPCRTRGALRSAGPGGTLAEYALRGHQVVYVCATRGEAGSADVEHLEGYASVSDMRSAELAAAAQALGRLKGGLAIVTIVFGTILAACLGVIAASVTILTLIALAPMITPRSLARKECQPGERWPSGPVFM